MVYSLCFVFLEEAEVCVAEVVRALPMGFALNNLKTALLHIIEI